MDFISPQEFRRALVIPSADKGPQPFESVMAPFQRERFEAIDPALMAVARGDKPTISRFWWEATKGASKDSDLSVCILWLLAMATRPLLCQVGAADADQAGELRKAARSQLHLNPWLGDLLDAQNWAIENHHTGARCEIISADNAGSHGARPDVLIINELTHIQKREFAENLADNSSKVPSGLCIIATNSGFLGSWQEKWRNLAMDSARWSFHQLAEPAPWLDQAEIDEAQRRNSTTRFLRLWRGVWVPQSGDAIDPADIQAAIMTGPKHLPQPGPMTGQEKGWRFTASLDIGVKHDHSALVVLASQAHRVRLALCQSWKPPKGGQVDLSSVEAAVLQVHRQFRPSAVCYDPSQALLMAQRLQKLGVPMAEVKLQGQYANEIATALIEAFKSKCIDLYRDEALIRDFERLTLSEKPYGYKLEAARDKHDGSHADRAMAFAMALPRAMATAAVNAGVPMQVGLGFITAKVGNEWNRAPRGNRFLRPFGGIV